MLLECQETCNEHGGSNRGNSSDEFYENPFDLREEVWPEKFYLVSNQTHRDSPECHSASTWRVSWRLSAMKKPFWLRGATEESCVEMDTSPLLVVLAWKFKRIIESLPRKAFLLARKRSLVQGEILRFGFAQTSVWKIQQLQPRFQECEGGQTIVYKLMTLIQESEQQLLQRMLVVANFMLWWGWNALHLESQWYLPTSLESRE